MVEQGVGLMSGLDEWQAWSLRQRRGLSTIREAKVRLRSAPVVGATLYRPAGEIRTVVVVDKMSPSCSQAVVEPLRHLSRAHTAVVLPDDVSLDMPEVDWARERYSHPNALGQDVRTILSLGAYLGLSRPLEQWARRRDIPFHLVQHGLMTPWSPPASHGAHVLAWCDSDAEYWSAGRPDLTITVVGSQLLWRASDAPVANLRDERPVMLGQLHGTELSRAEALRTYWQFCKGNGMAYRPHPNEVDVVSRGLHTVMQRAGMEFETSGIPLPELGRPVVSIFSTGTLEAAMRGLPAYVAHPDPPSWVSDFWRRYGLARWGDAPTCSWTMPTTEPAVEIARRLERA